MTNCFRSKKYISIFHDFLEIQRLLIFWSLHDERFNLFHVIRNIILWVIAKFIEIFKKVLPGHLLLLNLIRTGVSFFDFSFIEFKHCFFILGMFIHLIRLKSSVRFDWGTIENKILCKKNIIVTELLDIWSIGWVALWNKVLRSTFKILIGTAKQGNLKYSG